SYYQANYNSNLGKLRHIYDGYLSLTSTSPTSTSSQLLSDLNAINTVAPHEQNFKKVMRVLLEVYGSTASGLTEQQNVILTEVATRCRLSGGRAVLMARNALGLPVQNAGDCIAFEGSPEDRNQSAGSLMQVNVFPNPAKGALTVQTNSALENGTARLTNQNGQVLKTWTFTGHTLEVQDIALPSGLYLLEISEDGSVLHRSKIVIAQ
ncbi:MAG TPA: T9SS type A sorting domain-containing protein, partial [Saprospiraceae bacterium]|nr:T9SS type A sorting domain-containing protein [Saprospiraceae bacterium]